MRAVNLVQFKVIAIVFGDLGKFGNREEVFRGNLPQSFCVSTFSSNHFSYRLSWLTPLTFSADLRTLVDIVCLNLSRFSRCLR